MFSEVKQLQDATKGLIKWSERLAEVIQTVCNKVLNQEQSIDLHNELSNNIPRWTAPSPTPSCLAKKYPHNSKINVEDKEMDWDTTSKNPEEYRRNEERVV